MNNNGSVSEEVRARIRAIGDRMGYRPNRSAKAMRTGRSQTLGLVISDLGNPFYAEFARSVERAAAAQRYAVLLVDAQASTAGKAAAGETAERIAELMSHPVDGVISTVRYPSVLRLDVPVVFLGNPVRGRDSVTSDDVRGGKALAEHLLALGHRRFGLVTSPLPGGIPIRRGALIERLRGEARIVWEYQTPPTENVAPEVAMLLQRRDVTVIVCSNDIVAISVQRALRDLGIGVPDDVSVVGYDDIPWAAIVTPALTTMKLPIAEMGRATVRFILDRLQDPGRRSRRLSLPVTLVERESVAWVRSRPKHPD
jgi:LacI family transcriptional regulator